MTTAMKPAKIDRMIAAALDDPGELSMTKADRDALKLAIEMIRAAGGTQAAQIEDKIKDQGWIEAGKFASYCCQFTNLSLKPWETPVCCAEPDGDDPASLLLRRLRRVGVSRWHPHPLQALSAAAAPNPRADHQPATRPPPMNGG
jgi:hypothetical protein